jgi:hypothetical protein
MRFINYAFKNDLLLCGFSLAIPREKCQGDVRTSIEGTLKNCYENARQD